MRNFATLAAAAAMTAALVLGAQAQSSNGTSPNVAPGGTITNGTATPPSTNGMSNPSTGSGSMAPPAAGPRVGPNGTSNAPADTGRRQVDHPPADGG
jgi:hypothetical protein